MPIFLIIVDGAADRVIPQLGNKTPWEAADTPNTDELALSGIQGMIDVVPGIAPESDNGCMALLGYDPHLHYTGRGPLEGLGAGFLDGNDNVVCFRINFASWGSETGRLSRRTSRGLSDDELQQLAHELRTQVHLEAPFPISFDLQAYGRHRGLLCFKSPTQRLGYRVSNTDPLFKQAGVFGIPVSDAQMVPKKCEPLSGDEADIITAAMVEQFVAKSSQVLTRSEVNIQRLQEGKDPANFLLIRDAGSPPQPLQPFIERFGCTVSFHGQIAAEAGLMTLVGGKYYSAVPNRGEDNRSFFLRMAEDLVNGTQADVRCIHFVKDADEAGHDNNPEEKVRALEQFDSYFLGAFKRLVPSESVIVICSDHATPCELGIHSADPVPVLVSGLGADSLTTFGESSARRGNLHISAGCELMRSLTSHYQTRLCGSKL